jgi:pyruvate dehydrogenase kinase 2/3/4
MENARLGALRTVSSNPQGVKATVNEQVDRWQQGKDSFTTSLSNRRNPEQGAVSLHPRIGIGLPMSNIFAT